MTWSDRELLERGIAFGGKALPVLEWPFSPDARLVSRIGERTSAICRAAEIACEAFPKNEPLQRKFGYGPLQLECVLKDPGYRPLVPLGRLDSFLVGGLPRFMEFNTDGTAGWHYSAALTALWREDVGLPPEKAPLPDRLLETLLACFRQWDRRGVESPAIAIVDWKDVGTWHEQEALAKSFSARGFKTSRVDPRSVSLEKGRLAGPEGPIDLVYRRLVSEEAFARSEEIRPLLDAYLSDAACFVGGFRTDPAWSKTLFVVLTEPSNAALFPDDVREAIAACVPWTRVVAPGAVDFCGRDRDMEELLLSQKERFVLKPEKSYEGRGVTAGASSSSESWLDAVRKALREGGWVVQEHLGPEPVSVPDVGKAFLQVGEFVLGGCLAGFLPRVSPGEIITPAVRELYCPVAVELPLQPSPKTS